MTVCVAVKDKDGVVIATDSLMNLGSVVFPGTSKITYKNNYVVAFAGAGRIENIIQEDPEFDFKITSTKDVVTFRNLLLKKINDIGFVQVSVEQNEGVPVYPVQLLISNRKRVWAIHADGTLVEISDYTAIGSGLEPAIGALSALHDSNILLSSREKVRLAVMAAIKHSTYCGGKVQISK